MYPEKSSLSIRLTESVIALRTPQRTSRHNENETPLPATVRGVLTLKLAKATRISSIELELQAKATTHYVQSAGPSRVDVTERYKVHSTSAVVFKAGPASQERRRATSTRPRVQFLDDRTWLIPRHGTHLNGSGGGRQEALPETRSASLDPLWARRRPLSSDELETNYGRFPQRMLRSQVSIDPAPPYYTPADHHPFPGVDSNIAGRPQSVASGSRSPEPPSSVISSRNSLTPDISYSSSVSPHSIRGVALSRTSSIEEAPEDDNDSYDTSHVMGPDSVAYYGLSRIATGSSSRNSERSRSHSRFSLGKVMHVFEAVKERVRSRSPQAGSDDQEQRGRSLTKGKGKAQVSTTYGVRAVPQIEAAEPWAADCVNDQSSDGWLTFPGGTYTYPVFFTIPSNSPPTMKAQHGSLTWKVKAEVERPGAFNPKMTAEKEALLISVPKDDDSEEMGWIDLQQRWEEQLHYRVQIAGRSVPIGGKIPFQLTLTPMAKIKVHSIVAYLDERTDYYTQTQSRARSDVIRRATLLVIRDDASDHRHSIPIMPLISDDPDAFQKSPLHRFLQPGEDENEVASSFMGPGPWTICHRLSVPDSCSILHPSNQAKGSNVMVNHTLRLVLRVEKDEAAIMTGRKLYDIVVHVPVQILSCRCTSEWTSLPGYDDALRSKGDSPEDTLTCSCRAGRQAKARTHSHAADALSLRDTSPPTASNTYLSDSLVGCTQLHERLISGMVSERGEAPPSYECSGAVSNL